MAVSPIPAGYHTVTPSFTVEGADKALEFAKRTFGAQDAEVMRGPDGKIMHAEITIGDSRIMLGEASPQNPPTPGSLYVYVENCDEVYKKGVEAGGTTIMEPANQFWGDRTAALRDPSGIQWSIATRVEEVSEEEMQKRMKEMMPA